MIRIAATVSFLIAFSASGAMAAEVLVHDAKSQPESLTLAPDGTVFAGSAGSPYVYAMKQGAAQVFVDASAAGPGTFFFGQLADGASGTLWTCQLTPVPGVTPAQRHSSLRGFDLKTGKEKLRWNLPGENSVCNDFSIGPDKALYISDTAGSRIYRLKPGATAAELYLENPLLKGIDGITFLKGVLYVNSVITNTLYRIPVDAAGKPGAPLEIAMDMSLRGLDGMRAADGKLFLAANASGTVASLAITGDTAHVVVLKDGLNTPTGVEPAGDTLWFTERGTGKVWSIPLPK